MRTLFKRIGEIAIIYGVILLLLKGGILNRQYSSLIVPIGINILLAVSLNVTTGFLGELTLGHAGFMSVGAYAGALVTMNLELPMYFEFILALLIGGTIAAIFGFLIGVPVLRLHGDYLAIVTLAFGEIIKSIINVLPFTNGAKGLSGIELDSNKNHITLVFIIVVLSVICMINFIKTRQGRAICAIRDNYIAAESCGIKVSRYKVMAFVMAAFFAGVAGVIYAHNFGILKPTNFDYNKSIEILVIVVLGGMGSMKGSMIAAVILTILPEMLRVFSDYRMLLYAIVLIGLMLFNHSSFYQKLKDRKNDRETLRKEEI
ncbi:branched-chain amino acid transport system permease protein LivM [Lachnospiraceae bacterium KM106-2]|nr:branched-chain amino acid transport system permease protein LivM [Lachnospiraceae bacterium KM106-2]